MMKHCPCLFVSLLVVATLASSGPSIAAESQVAEVTGVYVLPDVRLKKLESTIANDRGILLGGSSDLWHGPDDLPNRFWMITDRGPNGKLKVNGQKRRTFPVPDFSPIILHVELADKKVQILKTIPLVDSAGKPVGGMSNLEGIDETPYDYQGRRRLPYNPNGLDSEGLIRTSSGDFWIAEEYSPSLVHCDANGKILKRFVPAGSKISGAGYPVEPCLPAVLAWRKKNRGFESLAFSRDGKTLYTALQSPLSNPNKRTGEHSRNVRLLAFDIDGQKPSAEYVYQLEHYRGFGPDAEAEEDIKVSGLTMVGDTTMLVLERTDAVARLYQVDLAKATNILDSRWDKPSTSPTLESLDDPSSKGVIPLPKKLVVDLAQLRNLPRKIEGIALIDSQTLAVTNDNDFDLGRFDSEGSNHGNGVKNFISVIRLKSPLTTQGE